MTSSRAVCLCVVVLHCLTVSVIAQNETLEATLTAQTLMSPGYPTNYSSDITYDWMIHTNEPNHTVQLIFSDCEMEFYKTCYDYVQIYDGYNSSADLISTYCCVDCCTTSGSFLSTGSDVYLQFVSDVKDEYRGFSLTYSSFITTTTTSTTTATTTSTTTTTTTTTTATTTTTTTSTTSTTTTPSTTTPAVATGSTSDAVSSTVIIIVSVVAGLLLLIALTVIIVCLIKNKNRPRTPVEPLDIPWKMELKRPPSTPVVAPYPKPGIPPVEPETNILDFDLPTGRANLLPPLSSQMREVKSN